uniref:Uncharacterized protein n=1 Tax=viral metagenome TaxID=1070528 RepID=A0A6C0KTR9_9ZZZZ
MHDVTYHGLHKWTCSAFERFGWMTLAARDHHKYKIDDFKLELLHLKTALENKIGKTEENDRRYDLHILHKNVDCLISNVNKLFKEHHVKK